LAYRKTDFPSYSELSELKKTPIPIHTQITCPDPLNQRRFSGSRILPNHFFLLFSNPPSFEKYIFYTSFGGCATPFAHILLLQIILDSKKTFQTAPEKLKFVWLKNDVA
jgi:hypothetical protein